MKMIGCTNVCKSLYYLESFPTSNQDFIHKYVFSYERLDVNFWQYRLGHPRYKAVEQICKIFPYVPMSSDTVCDTCHYAKQHKLPFLKYTFMSTECFEIIHCEI